MRWAGRQGSGNVEDRRGMGGRVAIGGGIGGIAILIISLGTSEQRMYWFKKGFETGDGSRGDTFRSNQ